MPELTTAREIEHVPIDVLQESDWNPNVETREVFDSLKASIRLNGLVDPLVVRRADDSVVGGHHRLYAVRELLAEGWVLPGGTIPVIYLDVSEEEAKRLSLALNKIRGEPDLDKLGELLRGLRDVSDPSGLVATGYSPQEIDDLVALLETDRDALVRSIEERDKGETDDLVALTFHLRPDDAQTVRDELDRLREKHNLIGKDADSAALIKMAERSARRR
jgi:ParB-like chromosome segregation protein Spo0J